MPEKATIWTSGGSGKRYATEQATYQRPHIYRILTACRSDTWRTVISRKAAAVVETSTNY